MVFKILHVEKDDSPLRKSFLLIKDDCVTTRFSKDELILKADVFDFV
jgi:hypothetical protein